MKQKFETPASSLSPLTDKQFVPSSSSSSSKLAQLLDAEKNSPSTLHATLTPSNQQAAAEHHDNIAVIIGSYNPHAKQNSIPKPTMSQHRLFEQEKATQVPMHNTIESVSVSVSDHELDSGSELDSLSQDDDDQLPFKFQ